MKDKRSSNKNHEQDFISFNEIFFLLFLVKYLNNEEITIEQIEPKKRRFESMMLRINRKKEKENILITSEHIITFVISFAISFSLSKYTIKPGSMNI
jgi:hypothetical protein